MIKLSEVRKLSKIEGRRGFLVSLYLNCNRAMYSKKELDAALRNLMKEGKKFINQKDASRLKNSVLNRLSGKTRGIACFVSSDDKIFKFIQIERPVSSRIFIGERSYIRPLLSLLDEYERYLVIVVDKEKARIFTVKLGEIEVMKELTDSYPGKHAQGGWSQARWQRHAKDHVRRHLKRVVNEAVRISRSKEFDRVILAGSKEILPDLEKLLPAALKKRYVGKFYTELFASDQKILGLSLKVEAQVERSKENGLVELLNNSLGKKGKGVIGLERTLLTLQEGKPMLVLINDNYYKKGYHCPKCDFLSFRKYDNCPYCEDVMIRVDDLINRIVRRAINMGVKVEFVKNNRKLKKLGNIGAILRY